MQTQPATAQLAFPVHVIAQASEAMPRRTEATLVALKNGRVLAAYANHVGRSDNARSHIALRQIDTAGHLIGNEWIGITPPGDGLNAMSPALRRLPDGRLGMLYSFRLGTTKAMRHFVTSKDEGKTWTPPVVVASGKYVTGCHDRFTILQSGRFVAPLHCSENWEDHYLYTRVATSDDNGRSWRVSEPLELPYVGGLGGLGDHWKGAFYESGCYEPGVVQRVDGSLLMTMRTAMGTQFCSESFDEGLTWSPLRSLEVVSPQAPANLVRIPGTPVLLLLWSSDYGATIGTGGNRRCISCGLSMDDGRTWPHHLRRHVIQDTVSSWDYPSVLFHNDELWMSIRYTAGARYLEKPASTLLMRIPMAWVMEPLAAENASTALTAMAADSLA
ncbi:sialidase family protein [Geminisphaera colitermitum]|uniref:sialidase family protein n=1 Tax=Geminisphaera colitermitum TaxID=1148786 RepID=UPI0001964F60|nr:sialidase family protein [Geminisphaera colitermitum]